MKTAEQKIAAHNVAKWKLRALPVQFPAQPEQSCEVLIKKHTAKPVGLVRVADALARISLR